VWKITIFNGKIHYKWPFSIENHHFKWENSLSMAIFNSYFDITRGYFYGHGAMASFGSAAVAGCRHLRYLTELQTVAWQLTPRCAQAMPGAPNFHPDAPWCWNIYLHLQNQPNVNIPAPWSIWVICKSSRDFTLT
jgi:hypothetical protein